MNIPPYWQYQRGTSQASVRSALPAPITLEDHTSEPSEQTKALWAKSVHIDDYVVVAGTRAGVGAYVVYNCTIEMLDVGILSCGQESETALRSLNRVDQLPSGKGQKKLH